MSSNLPPFSVAMFAKFATGLKRSLSPLLPGQRRKLNLRNWMDSFTRRKFPRMISTKIVFLEVISELRPGFSGAPYTT